MESHLPLISGRVARSNDGRKYILSGHVELPISHIRADKKISTNGTNCGELAIVLLDLVGVDAAHSLIDRFKDEVCDKNGIPLLKKAVHSRDTDIPAGVRESE